MQGTFLTLKKNINKKIKKIKANIAKRETYIGSTVCVHDSLCWLYEDHVSMICERYRDLKGHGSFLRLKVIRKAQ